MQTIDRFSDSESSLCSVPDPVWTPVNNRRLSSSDRPSRVSTTASSSMAADPQHQHFHDDSSGASCAMDDASLGSEGDVSELSDPLPTADQLREAGNIPIYDADGQSIPFRSLYQGPEHQGQRQLLVFIRHFYCGGCQTYVRRLTETISPSVYFSLPIPTTITIIGCGEPHIIPHHAIKSHCPFRYYAEPTRKLYKIFNMPTTHAPGRKPNYADHHLPTMFYRSVSQLIKGARHDGFKFKGGNVNQIGGEFLFEDGLPVWCHRMRDMRSHAEMEVLRRVLGTIDVQEDDEPPDLPQDSRRTSLKTSRKSMPADGFRQPGGLQLVYNTPPSTAKEPQTPKARLVRNGGRPMSLIGR